MPAEEPHLRNAENRRLRRIYYAAGLVAVIVILLVIFGPSRRERNADIAAERVPIPLDAPGNSPYAVPPTAVEADPAPASPSRSPS